MLEEDERDRARTRAARSRAAARSSAGMERVKRLVRVDQKPIGRTPRSNLATYTGLFDAVRKLFAATKAARARALRRGPLFVQRCEGPLPDVRGRRLRDGRAAVSAERVCAVPDLSRRALQRRDARRSRIAARSIADVLALTVDAAWEFFAGEAAGAPFARRAAPGRSRLSAPRSAGDRTFRRRSAAHQARDRTAARAARRYALRAR